MYNIATINNFKPIYNPYQTKTNMVANINAHKNSPQTQPINNFAPINFGNAAMFCGISTRTSLTTNEEKKQFNEISALLDKTERKELNTLLKSGKLLNNNSNNNTTTLESLHKIATNARITGLDKKRLLKDVINRISNPFIITQKFGQIPVSMQNEIIQQEKNEGKNISALDLDVKSSTCPAASIEFNLAHKMPAEFARMAEELTSEKMSVTKKINVKELSQGLVDTIWMLNEFGTEHKMDDWNTLSITMRPDRNAIIRARIQNTIPDDNKTDQRSAIDVLMQSTLMNVGAQNTYDSLVDKRTPKYNDDDSGLIDIEKNFAEELATGKGKVCVTYQQIDDSGKLVGYECPQEETLSHIKSTLQKGENVIIGYTYCDSENNVIGGHEITIIGIEADRQGNMYFVCNDTDDGVSEPVTYPVSELLPKIHHAGIPKSVLVDNVEFVDGWKELMQIYKDTKTQQQVQYAVQNNPLQVLNQAT